MYSIYTERLREKLINQKINEKDIKLYCDYAENLLSKDLPVIFDKAHLSQVLQIKNLRICYNTFQIQGNTKNREITAPSRNLKLRQKWILENILERIKVGDSVHGFVKNKSIVTNAKQHVKKTYMLNMDISNFFISIKQPQVMDVFHKIGYVKDVAEYLAELCCFKGVLPQGAPTSPYLSNIICMEMDVEIFKLADEYKAIFSRYADDITLSSEVDLNECVVRITAIIEKYGFKVNCEKTRITNGKYRKIVTGLVVGEQVKVPKKYKRKLKQEIYYCQKFGVSTHLKNSNSKKLINYKEYLYGKAYYIKMVEPEIGKTFLDELDKINWY